jgi:hypothetical protein
MAVVGGERVGSTAPRCLQWVPLEAVVEGSAGDLVTRVLDVGREAEA